MSLLKPLGDPHKRSEHARSLFEVRSFPGCRTFPCLGFSCLVFFGFRICSAWGIQHKGREDPPLLIEGIFRGLFSC